MRKGLALIVCLTLMLRAVLAQDARVASLDTYLRLRAAPSIEGLILNQLEAATPLTLLGRNQDDSWLLVRIPDGEVGWVFADYVELAARLESVAVVEENAALVYGQYLNTAVAEHVRTIFQQGQRLGNHPDVFTKVGDSISVSTHMLHPIGDGLYRLGEFGYLQDVIDYFSAAQVDDGNSFNHTSLATAIGWTTQAVLNPAYADSTLCEPGEPPLVCEYRRTRPAAALILFGSNDVQHLSAGRYHDNLNRIVEISLARGVIPIVSTIPDREDYEEAVATFNQIVYAVTQEHSIPLWDYAMVMRELPNGGLDEDGVHPSIPPRGYQGAADFRAENLYYGYVLRNLTALHMLRAVWQAIWAGGT